MKDFTIVEELDIHGNNRWRCNICGEVFNKMGTAPHLGGHRRAVERGAVKNSSAITPVQQLKAEIAALCNEFENVPIGQHYAKFGDWIKRMRQLSAV